MIFNNSLWNILNAAGFSVGVIGLLISVIAIRSSSRANQILARTLEDVAGSLSTAYIGKFPDYLPNVADMISRAKNTVLIAYIIATPGIYNAYGYWRLIKQAMENVLDADPRIEVKAVFADDETATEYLEDQFKPEMTDWIISRKEPKFRAKLDAFAHRYRGNDYDVSNMTKEDFTDTYIIASDETINGAYSGAAVRVLKTRPQIYMWIVDREAIFVLQSVETGFTTYAFRTNDQKIVDGLISIHNEYCKKSLPYRRKATPARGDSGSP